MLSSKMESLRIAIEQILESFTREYCETVFDDRIIKDELILQIMMECCKYAYDCTAEKHSLRYYCRNIEDNNEDYFRMTLQRIAKKIYNYRESEYKYRKEQTGVELQGLLSPSMHDINEKRVGYEFTEFQYWELKDVHDNQLMDDIVSGRILNKKNDLFRKEAKEYDDTIIKKISCCNSIKERFFAAMASFTLEWKYSLNFMYEIVTEMEKYGISKIDDLIRKYNLFCGSVALSNVDIQHIGGSVYTDSRMLNIRRKFICDFVHMNEREFKECEHQFEAALYMRTIIYIKLRDWVKKNTVLEDWLSVAETYNINAYFIENKDWTNKKIRYIKEIWRDVNYKYKKS